MFNLGNNKEGFKLFIPLHQLGCYSNQKKKLKNIYPKINTATNKSVKMNKI